MAKYLSPERRKRTKKAKNLIKCKLLLLINVCALPSALAGVSRAYGKAGSFYAQKNEQTLFMCKSGCIRYDFPAHYFHVEMFSPTVAPMSRYVPCRFSHFPTQPANENNNFDHNKAAKIISRGS